MKFTIDPATLRHMQSKLDKFFQATSGPIFTTTGRIPPRPFMPDARWRPGRFIDVEMHEVVDAPAPLLLTWNGKTSATVAWRGMTKGEFLADFSTKADALFNQLLEEHGVSNPTFGMNARTWRDYVTPIEQRLGRTQPQPMWGRKLNDFLAQPITHHAARTNSLRFWHTQVRRAEEFATIQHHALMASGAIRIHDEYRWEDDIDLTVPAQPGRLREYFRQTQPAKVADAYDCYLASAHTGAWDKSTPEQILADINQMLEQHRYAPSVMSAHNLPRAPEVGEKGAPPETVLSAAWLGTIHKYRKD